MDDFASASNVNGLFSDSSSDVKRIFSTKDRKVDFIELSHKTIAYVHSALGYPAMYEVESNDYQPKAKAVLMDLDGTSVHSESFWIWIIQQTIAELLDNPKFELEDADLPYVSGHSVSEHLQYCIDKYCPDQSVEAARQAYFRITDREMQAISDGHGRTDAFTPAPHLKEFLMRLRENNIKIGLVTSGLYAKAWPEILSAFRELKMGDPVEFYDAIITAGCALKKGQTGTLGELSPKPHP